MQTTPIRPAVYVTESAGIYSTRVVHPCGHAFVSGSRWNDAAAARRHGRRLLTCACSTCRDAR